MQVFFSPAVLLSQESQGTFLFNVMAALDIFIIWRIIVIALGFAAIYKYSLGKSLTTIGGLYILQVVIRALLGGPI
jgi:hypothetical protein